MESFSYVITDPLGIHARPAGMITKLAMTFESEITLQTQTAVADAKRIMAVMRLVAKQGTSVMVICKGKDEAQAAKALKEFLQENL